MNQDPYVRMLMNRLMERSSSGDVRSYYQDSGLSIIEWLGRLEDELMDAAVCIESLRVKMESDLANEARRSK